MNEYSFIPQNLLISLRCKQTTTNAELFEVDSSADFDEGALLSNVDMDNVVNAQSNNRLLRVAVLVCYSLIECMLND